jgi:hypothetical protein
MTWITADNYGDGWDEFRIPATADLVDKKLSVRFDKDDRVIDYTFTSPASLVWTAIEGTDKGISDTVQYDASCIASNLYFVDFVGNRDPDTAVSLILNLDSNQVLAVVAKRPDLETARSSYYDRLGNSDLSTMKVEYWQGVIGERTTLEDIKGYERTEELLGKWVRYRYTSDHIYEHIYVTNTHFAWHCLGGPDKGLACTEPCDYWKLASKIYMIVWRESVHPVCAVSIIDLQNMRTMGKQFCMHLASGKKETVLMGSYATLVGGRFL